MENNKTAPCHFCEELIPDSGVFGLPTYTDVPENHKKGCPIREIMEVRLSREGHIDCGNETKNIINVKRVLVHYKCCKCLEKVAYSVGVCSECNFRQNFTEILGVSIKKSIMQRRLDLPPCGNPKCGASTTIADQASFGFGKLDNYGYWERPCEVCAKAFKIVHPDREVWPEA